MSECSDVVVRAREALDGITPGEWIAEYSAASGHCVIDSESRNCLDSIARTMHVCAAADARFIAAAPALVRDLCAEVEHLRALVASGKTAVAAAVAETARETEARIRAEADRDAARALVATVVDDHDCGQNAADLLDRATEAEEAIARVEALTYADDDGTEYSHTAAFTACEGESTCPACWAASIRAALRGER